jgi:rhamnose transport system substrate-binding protein
MTRRFFSWGLTGLAIALMLAGCGEPVDAPPKDGAKSSDEAPPAEARKLKIGVMPKLVGIDYFNAAEIGAKEAGEALGVEVDYDGPVDADVTKQVQLIDTWITRKYDAICVAPNDPDAISDVLNKARKRGIKIITWDTDSQKDARDFFVNQTTSEGIAHAMMDIMAEGVGPDAKFINITGTLTAANQNTWMGIMEEYRKAKFPGMTNLSETPKESGEDQARATQVAADSLKAYPDLQGIFALTSVALPGSAEALRKAGAADKVFLTGLATPKAMKEYVLDGTVQKFVLWNVPDLGYLTVHAAVAAVKGELTEGAASFNTGRITTSRIEGSEIILGDPLVFTRENIENFDY